MRRRSFLFFCLMASIAGTTLGCKGAIPSPETSQRSITRYLNHYAKKHPTSDIGAHALQKVEIDELRLDKKGHANATAFFSLADLGLYQAGFTLKHEPFGWKVVSWEILERP